MSEYVRVPTSTTVFPMIVVKKTEGRDSVVSFKKTKKATTTDDYCDFRGFYNPIGSKSTHLLFQAFDNVCEVVKSLNLSDGDLVTIVASFEVYVKQINCGISKEEPVVVNALEYSWKINNIGLINKNESVSEQSFKGKYEKLSKERLYSNNAPINFD